MEGRAVKPALLLAQVRLMGADVEAQGDRLVLERGAGPLPDDVMRQVRAAKTDLLALLRREAERLAQAVRSVETQVPEEREPGRASDWPAPWQWVAPDLGREDLALLRGIERLDHPALTVTAGSCCYGCGERDWWRARIGGHLVCRRCHPPVPSAEETP